MSSIGLLSYLISSLDFSSRIINPHQDHHHQHLLAIFSPLQSDRHANNAAMLAAASTSLLNCSQLGTVPLSWNLGPRSIAQVRGKSEMQVRSPWTCFCNLSEGNLHELYARMELPWFQPDDHPPESKKPILNLGT